MTTPLSPLHAALPDGRFVLALLFGLPLLGACQGLLAAVTSLPVARRTGGWLLHGGGATATGTRWHLLAGAGVGVVHAVLAVLAVVAAPERLLWQLATVHPALRLGAGNVAAVALLGAAFLTVDLTATGAGGAAGAGPAGASSGLSPAARRTAAAYLLALALVGFAGAELVVLVR